jgi:hypothetical protein
VIDAAGLLPRLAVALQELADAGQTQTYGALARTLNCRMGELTEVLETLMEADAAANLPLRAALCEARLTPGQPAPGFFIKAAALGFDIPDPADFVARHRAALFAQP